MSLSNTQYAKSLLKGTAQITGVYAALGQPDVVVGFVPLYTVTSIDWAHSQDILKYRAVGAQFLAKQHGGNFSLRIDCTLVGALGLATLTALEALYMYGGRADNLAGRTNAWKGSGYLGYNDAIGFKAVNATEGEYNEQIAGGEQFVVGEDVRSIPGSDYEWISNNKFKTYNVMSKDFIFYEMFIESMIVYKSVKAKSPQAINVSLLFRRRLQEPRVTGYTLYNIEQKRVARYEIANPVEVVGKNDKVKNLPLAYTKNVQRLTATVQAPYPNKSYYMELFVSVMARMPFAVINSYVGYEAIKANRLQSTVSVQKYLAKTFWKALPMTSIPPVINAINVTDYTVKQFNKADIIDSYKNILIVEHKIDDNLIITGGTSNFKCKSGKWPYKTISISSGTYYYYKNYVFIVFSEGKSNYVGVMIY